MFWWIIAILCAADIILNAIVCVIKKTVGIIPVAVSNIIVLVMMFVFDASLKQIVVYMLFAFACLLASYGKLKRGDKK